VQAIWLVLMLFYKKGIGVARAAERAMSPQIFSISSHFVL